TLLAACIQVPPLIRTYSAPPTGPRTVVAAWGLSTFTGALAHQKRSLMDEKSGSPDRISLAGITRAGSGLPNRAVFHGVEGVGKTSFGACAPRPIFLMTRGETGLVTLIDSGQVPETAHFPELATWTDLLGAIEALTSEAHDYRTLVIDTLNGAERLC